jgi:hypothetical protein
MSFHDEAIAEIGESQFVNTDEMPGRGGASVPARINEIARSSRAMTILGVEF